MIYCAWGEWNLPGLVGGINVRRALDSQCAALYRGWRYRLKEENFVGYTKQQAKARRPPGIDPNKWNWLVDEFWSDPKQQEKSEKNRRNRMKQTIKHSNGAKSTARILEELINAPSTQPLNNGDSNANANGEVNANADGDGTSHIQHDEDPIYVKLYDKTHRHKDGTLDLEAEVNLNQLKDLHAKQIEEHGVDNLTPFEAFPKVLSECSGYIRGLGYGPKPSKRLRISADTNEMRDEIQQLQQAATQRESEIQQLQQAATQRETEISDLKSENILLKEQMDEMKLSMQEREKKMKEESVEREKRLRQELMAEFTAMMKSSKY